MQVLMVGGAGLVGSIVRPAVEMEHDVWVYDRHAVSQAAHPTIVADVEDDTAIKAALAGMDAVTYMALGAPPDGSKRVGDVDLAFNINARALYRFLKFGFEAGVKRFVYTSTFDVYGSTFGQYHRHWNRETRSYVPDPEGLQPLKEDDPLLGWETYAISKRIGETICQAAADINPEAVIVVLRLITPRDEANFAAAHRSAKRHGMVATGPNDLRRLMVASLALDRPGCHIVQASSDVEGERFSNARATELLGWTPQGD